MLFLGGMVQKGHIVNLARDLFNDMRSYILVSCFPGLDGKAGTYSKPKKNCKSKPRLGPPL